MASHRRHCRLHSIHEASACRRRAVTLSRLSPPRAVLQPAIPWLTSMSSAPSAVFTRFSRPWFSATPGRYAALFMFVCRRLRRAAPPLSPDVCVAFKSAPLPSRRRSARHATLPFERHTPPSPATPAIPTPFRFFAEPPVKQTDTRRHIHRGQGPQ